MTRPVEEPQVFPEVTDGKKLAKTQKRINISGPLEDFGGSRNFEDLE